MNKPTAPQLKVMFPVESDETESESEVKCEYLLHENDGEFGFEEKTVPKLSKRSGNKRRKRTSSFSFDDSSSEDESELEEKRIQDMDTLVKKEVIEKNVAEDGLQYEEPPGEDTDSDDNCWPMMLQRERDDESKIEADTIMSESDNESEEDWCEEGCKRQEESTKNGNDEAISKGDISQAKFVLRNITSRIPLIEETAIRRGVKLSGPPLEFSTTHLDEYARKFRWPLHAQNLRNTNFSQDPIEILEDFELLTTAKQSDSELPASLVLLERTDKDVLQESAFAQIPRPMVALAAGALRRSSRKRKRTSKKNAPSGLLSASTLLNCARVGGQFSDHFVESLLAANGKALQGIGSEFNGDIDKRCWSSLPTKKKPIANWRFVVEHIRGTMSTSMGFLDAVYPPMKQETLDRITNRLKTLHGCTTQHEETDIFERGTPATSKTNAKEAASEDQTGNK
ncbi:unnamed protein product [Peronospora belbahrii]|uniref:Uncharacterized protein n=1 Tax=Peronospora belbahrii TaxID=622444 RepID=A0ABN8CUV2_9STRA|nr:unnamed protein product [Peronospora belbahrii]